MIAKYIDILLVAFVALTFAMVLYKGVQLYLGALVMGRALPVDIAKASEHSLADRKEAVGEELERLEGGMSVIATIAASAPFVGLMGTVLHIMDALSKISGASLDIGVISGPIAVALNSTLIGLASAVPAAIAYNMYNRRIQVLDNAARRAFDRE